MNIRKMLEEIEPVTCEEGPEPTVYEMIVSYYLNHFNKAEAHRLASKYIDELLKRAGYVAPAHEPDSGVYIRLEGSLSAEEEALQFWSMKYESAIGRRPQVP